MHLRHALRRLTSRVKISGKASNVYARYCCTTSSKTLFSNGIEGGNSKELPDPFYVVADELTNVADRLHQVFSEEPMLMAAAQHFVNIEVEGKQFRPTVLLLMASALNMPLAESVADGGFLTSSNEIRSRQRSIVDIAEMIHLSTLLHDEVVDDAETSCRIKSLGNQITIHAGNFLQSRVFETLAALRNIEVLTLLSSVFEDLVKGKVMQMTATKSKCYSMEDYMQQIYYKTASLISKSCKAIALLAGQTMEVSQLAYEFGRHFGLAFQMIDDLLDFTDTLSSLGKDSPSYIGHKNRPGLITAPMLFAMEEFPQLHDVIERGFDDQSNVDTVLPYLEKSQGIQRTRDLVVDHAARAMQAINSLPESDDENVMGSRRALTSLTHCVIATSISSDYCRRQHRMYGSSRNKIVHSAQ